MWTDCQALILERIRQSGPLTVAAYMDLALYAPGLGYYARADQRSGRAGDFFTSVDLGPLFGSLLAERFAGMARSLPAAEGSAPSWDLVEAAAGNARLSRDVLDALLHRYPADYSRLRLTLVERSAQARTQHRVVLGLHAERLAASIEDLPSSIRGVVFANELLDAMPVHVVAMTAAGLAEVYVDARDGRLVERLGPLSTSEVATYFTDLGIDLEPGARADVNLAALDWIRGAAARLAAGYLVLIDYGFEARQLFPPAHATSTLRTFHRHLADAPGPDGPRTPAWMVEPGSRDLTTHVDFTSVRRVAEQSGLSVLFDADQSRFLLDAAELSGLLQDLAAPDRQRERLALKTLLVPGGLGATHRVLVFSKHAPPLSTRL